MDTSKTIGIGGGAATLATGALAMRLRNQASLLDFASFSLKTTIPNYAVTEYQALANSRMIDKLTKAHPWSLNPIDHTFGSLVHAARVAGPNPAPHQTREAVRVLEMGSERLAGEATRSARWGRNAAIAAVVIGAATIAGMVIASRWGD